VPESVVLHHVGIVIRDRKDVDRYTSLLGQVVTCDEYVEAFDCDCIFLDRAIPCVELVLPRSGALQQFSDKGGGLHHCAYQTDDLVRYMREFADGKGRWLYPSPVRGARGMLVNFMAPQHLGILIEIVEEGH
jgi:methylmalonyl-CoA/ethylmalonyl-CoA epimerase